MEAAIRRPYQGVINIIRFNWHFYAVAGVVVLLLLLVPSYANDDVLWICFALAVGIVVSTGISLLVSHYVYDRSSLYNFAWLSQLSRSGIQTIVNVHAGFDETSAILKKSFLSAELKVFDFYDPVNHTEVSIERARKAYPAYKGTIRITTSELPLADKSAAIIFNIFALHEIRKGDERIRFLKEQVRALRDDGKVVLVEHLRDVPNFLAYNIGFFHFLPGKAWSENFKQAGLRIENKLKITPFVTVLILGKADGNTP